MKTKIKKNKGEIPTMVLKSDKEKKYVYPLKSGGVLEFENKNFPLVTIQNQLTLF